MPYFDRLDYCSILCNEHLFCFVFEILLRCLISVQLALIRLICLEFTRVFNCCLAVACMFMDLGCLSPLLWSFEERDKLMTFFDLFCGCRMHCAVFFLCGIFDDFCFGLCDVVLLLVLTLFWVLDLYDFFVLNNRLFYLRLRGLGILEFWDIMYTSASGVSASATGILGDCSLYASYDAYFLVAFCYVVAHTGDAFDSLVLRLCDVRMSLIIVNQTVCLFNTYAGGMTTFDYFMCELSIEGIIMLFFSLWALALPGITTGSVEHPKGEYSLLVVFLEGLCGSVRISCADFVHLCILDILLRGFMLSDIVAIIGNIDMVFGSVDR